MSEVPPIPAGRSRSGRAVPCLVAALVALGLAGVVLALGPTAAWLERVTLVDLDRSVRHPDPALADALRAPGLALAAACALLAALVVWRRDDVAHRAARASADVRGLAADLRAGASEWWRTSTRAHLAALLAIVLLAAVQRLALLDRAMRPDEAISFVFFSSRSLADVLTDYSTTNNHVLYNVLAHLAQRLFGPSPEVLRLPAVVAGVLVVPAVYAFARRLFGGGPALLAAGLVAGAPEMILRSTAGRGYTLITLLFVVALAAAVRLRARPGPAAWALFVAAGALGCYAIPIMLYPLAVVACWLLFAAERERRLPIALGVAGVALTTAAVAAVLYAPVFLRSGPESLLSNRWIAPIGRWALYARTRANLVELAHAWTVGLPLLVVALLFAGALASLLVRGRAGLRGATYWLAAAAGVLAITALKRAVPEVRYLQFAFPLAAVLTAAGLADLVRRLGLPERARGAALGVGGLALAAAWPALAGPPVMEAFFEDLEQLIAEHEGELDDGDALVAHRFDGTAEVARYYLMLRGRPPTLVHKHVPTDGVEPLARYADVLVVLRRRDDMPIEPVGVALALEASPEEYARLFHPPVLVRRYRGLDLFRVESRFPPPAGSPPARAALWYPQTL